MVARPGARAAVVEQPFVDFMSDDQFISSMGIPEGRYACWFDLMMHHFTKADGTPGKGPEQLKVRVTAWPIDENGVSLSRPEDEPKYGYYGLGSKAHLSFAPDPATGKRLLPLPGGTSTKFTNLSNWGVFRDSLRGCGMPNKFVTSDFTPLDGVWLRFTVVAAPEGRKALRAGKTADVEEQDADRPDTVSVPLEAIDGGRVWDGQAGGLLEAAPAPAARPAPGRPAPPAAKAAAAGRPAPRAAAAPAPVAAEEETEDVATVATNAIASFFEDPKNVKGAAKAALRTFVFRTVSETVSPDMGQQVLNAYFEDVAVLGGILGEFGYVINGAMIKATA